jgi:hypothetical protein
MASLMTVVLVAVLLPTTEPLSTLELETVMLS